MSAASPRVSVVMPVFNAEPYVGEAVESVLQQTLRDFELVVLDDGSTDASLDVVCAAARRDSRVRVIEGRTRSGVVASSNRVVRESIAPVVARLDADDIACPERLERQLAILDTAPDVDLVGCAAPTIDPNGQLLRAMDLARLLVPSPIPPFTHSAAMFRRVAFERVGGYDPSAAGWEDADLFRRLATEGKAVVVPDALILHRYSAQSFRARDIQRHASAVEAMRRGLQGRAGGSDRAAPSSFVAAGSIPLWLGRRPHVVRNVLDDGPLLRRGGAASLTWAIWAEVSPHTLRAFLRARLAVRNGRARRVLGARPWVAWRPPTASTPARS